MVIKARATMAAVVAFMLVGCTSAPGPAAPIAPEGGGVDAGPPPVAVVSPGPKLITGKEEAPQRPHLLLDLPLGDDPEQPGQTTARVGGVAPAGPRDLVVIDGETIFLLDAAKGRLLRYSRGQLAERTAIPWADAESHDLRYADGLFRLVSRRWLYTFDLNGRIIDLAPAPPEADWAPDAYPVTVGTDAIGYRYERHLSASGGQILRRIDPTGEVAATVLPPEGDVVRWLVTPEGGAYTLSWKEDRAQVHELLRPMAAPAPGTGPAPAAKRPVAFERPVPTRLRVSLPGGVSAEIADELVRSNLWHHLAGAKPLSDRAHPLHDPLQIEASFESGPPMRLEVAAHSLRADGTPYEIPWLGDAIQQMLTSYLLHPLRLEPLVAAAQVSLAIDDLPGVERELTPAQQKALVDAIRASSTTSVLTVPHPLELPFPRYSILVKTAEGEMRLALRGERHLTFREQGALALSADFGAQVREWLPVPPLTTADLASLYRADGLEMNGDDLTRWKATVVRKLLLPSDQIEPEPISTDPITFTFYVGGVKRVVEVDQEGYTYMGQRHQRPGLLNLRHLWSVP